MRLWLSPVISRHFFVAAGAFVSLLTACKSTNAEVSSVGTGSNSKNSTVETSTVVTSESTMVEAPQPISKTMLASEKQEEVGPTAISYSVSNNLEDAEIVIEDSAVVDPDVNQVQQDSELSPAEISDLVPDDTPHAIESNFPLCEDSIYIREWLREFDTQWRLANARNYKKKSQQDRALSEARTNAFLQLLFPALGNLDFDFPVVVNEDVLRWMQYFQTRGRRAMVTWLKRAQDIVPVMHPILEHRGLPRDLVYLSMIESGFSVRAVSVARAVGPWQFMPATGRNYSLRIDDFVDERRDPVKATIAATNYLTNLYAMFGDWHLAAASYNAGEGRIQRALRRAPAHDDFFSLSESGRLPNETRNYVPKLIAAMIIAKSPAKFGFDVTSGSRALKHQTIDVAKAVSLDELAKKIGLDVGVLKDLNPELRFSLVPPPVRERPVYPLRVPEAYAVKVADILPSLESPSLYQRVTARVKKRESVKQFAALRGINLKELLVSNPTISATTRLNKGQNVVIPVRLGTGEYERYLASASPGKKKSIHSKNSKSGKKYISTKYKKSKNKRLALKKLRKEASFDTSAKAKGG